jgi:alkylation response protein AidB-like acyl-CoA dehydrogenase
VDVIEEVSRADGSAGWNLFVGQATTFVAWLEPGVAKQLVADNREFMMCGVFAPTGKARRDDDDLVVDGRWSFTSGCSHSDWFANGVIVTDDDASDAAPQGRPNWRFAVLPARDVEIIDTWHVAGLRGTGSHDTAAHGARIPIDYTIMPFFEPARFDGPLYRLPFPTILSTMIVGFPLGVARRALDEFVALAHTKSMVPQMPPMAQDTHVEIEVAHAEGALRAARAYVDDALGDAWATVCNGDDMTMEQRGNVLMAVQHAARTARAVVGTVYSLAGGSAIYDDNPIQRCARDIEAGTQHIFFGVAQSRSTGRILFGLDPENIRV